MDAEKSFNLILGDCLEQLKPMTANSVDAVITDPPYGLSFMGKKWDYEVPGKDIWAEVFRVLKPGGHLLSFGGTRTYHRLVLNIEDAGFEIRDQIQWLYGSGFPKSQNVALAIDKQSGSVGHRGKAFRTSGAGDRSDIQNKNGRSGMAYQGAATDDARTWQGWGTALKPANEPIVLARKPLSESTVAKNVLRWGTGALNIDGGRIATTDNLKGGAYSPGERTRNESAFGGGVGGGVMSGAHGDFIQPQGRWPANLLLDEEAAAMLDEQSGNLHGAGTFRHGNNAIFGSAVGEDASKQRPALDKGGGASRFFKVIKQDQYDIFDQCIAPSVQSNSIDQKEPTVHGAAPEKPRQKLEDKGQCENIIAPSADSSLRNIPETSKARKSSAQKSAMQNTDSASPCPVVKYAETHAENIATAIAQSIAATRPDLIPELLHGLGFISDCKSSTQNPNLASIAGSPANTDTILTIQNCSKLFGSVLRAIASTTIETAKDMESGDVPTRFRYQAKASKSERNAGLEGMPEREKKTLNSFGDQTQFECPDGASREGNKGSSFGANVHPTVKPIKLMEYLCKLITPPGGIILDPFLGSGSTLVAAKRLGFQGIGIEMSEEYLEIARRRIEHTCADEQTQLDLEA